MLGHCGPVDVLFTCSATPYGTTQWKPIYLVQSLFSIHNSFSFFMHVRAAWICWQRAYLDIFITVSFQEIWTEYHWNCIVSAWMHYHAYSIRAEAHRVRIPFHICIKKLSISFMQCLQCILFYCRFKYLVTEVRAFIWNPFLTL